MDTHLLLTPEGRLRLKKILERVEKPLLEKPDSSLSFQTARKLLKDFADPMSPLSKTKELVERILLLTGEASKEKDEIRSCLLELSSVSGG